MTIYIHLPQPKICTTKALNHRWAATGFPDDVGNAFRAHLRCVLAAGRNLAVIAGMKNVRLTIAGYGDLPSEHHDPRIEIMRMHVFGATGLLPSIHDIKAFTPQVAFEGLAGKRAAVSASA